MTNEGSPHEAVFHGQEDCRVWPIQTSATVADGFELEHYGRASGVFHPVKQGIANDGILRSNVVAINQT